MDFYEFVLECQEQGLTAAEAENEWYRFLAREEEERIEAYEDDPEIQYGWYQQDLIDCYRYER